jgi:surface antigen
MLIFEGIPPTTSPLIQTVIQVRTSQVVEPEPVYTIEDKIRLNVNNCDESTQWISAEDATCIPKRVNRPVQPQKTARGAVNASQGNTYAYGYCTHFAKEYTGWVPNGWGNANRWASNARSQGYTVSSTPIVGAVAQTSSGRLGHVAVVTGIGDGTVTIIEKNYNGWNVVSSRTVSVNSFVYIY